MREETETQKRVRELQREAWEIEQAEKKAERLATVEKFKQIEGWEQKLCDAVLASIHAGESGAHVKLLSFAFPPTDDPLDNVSAWVSVHIDVAWLDYERDAADIKSYENWDGPRTDRYGVQSFPDKVDGE